MLSLRRPQNWLLAGALLALALPARAAEVDKYIPDNTQLLVTINVKQLVEAPLVKKYALDKLRELLKGNEEVSKIMKSLDFDPFKDLTSVTVCSPEISQEPKGVAMVAHGQFDATKIAAKAEETAKEKADNLKIHKNGGHTVYEVKGPGDDKPMFVGILDNSTIFASNDTEAVDIAFAKAAGKKESKLNPEMQTLAEKVPVTQSISVVATGSALAKSDFAAMADNDKSKKSLEKLESVGLGVTVNKDIKVAVTLTAKSADGAKELAEEMKEGLTQAKGLVALMAGNMEKMAPVMDLLNSIKVNTEGKIVTVKGEATEEQIEKGLKKE